jgi:hypothetical protein
VSHVPSFRGIPGKGGGQSGGRRDSDPDGREVESIVAAGMKMKVCGRSDRLCIVWGEKEHHSVRRFLGFAYWS